MDGEAIMFDAFGGITQPAVIFAAIAASHTDLF
jgi:hypothetical protein